MIKKLLGLACTAAVAFVLVGSVTGCGDDKKKPAPDNKTTQPEPPPSQRR
jgi:hypothetical protein